MKKNKRHSRPGHSPVLFIAPAAVLICAGLIFVYARHSAGPKNDACADNVALLEALEASDISQTEKELQALKEADKAAELSQMQESITEEGALLSDVEIKQAFSGTVILGDSITESIMEYGYLDTDVVVSKRGLSVADADQQIDTAIGLHPSVVFMAFGSNDLETYESDFQPFIDAYRGQLTKLQEALPDTPIYINSILPLLPSAIEATPALGYYPEYNTALEALCSEMGCTFIDNSFIVANDESLYEPDGEHVIQDFYPRWLTSMAEMAGL